jgi:hypothetical protein
MNVDVSLQLDEIFQKMLKRTWTQSRAMTARAPQRKLNSRSELEITKITLGDLRSICVQKWVLCMVV